MARLRLEIGEEAFHKLIEEAAAEHRPPQWHAEHLLLKALGVNGGDDNGGRRIRQLRQVNSGAA